LKRNGEKGLPKISTATQGTSVSNIIQLLVKNVHVLLHKKVSLGTFNVYVGQLDRPLHASLPEPDS
jgi:hypothetical protein